ncbi:imm68 putative immunity domain-containing protein [uncultured Aquimarina sp.]|uniref:imm68 putative immunity domain-containing protein n=1 Tax=uncultured Aquimarina sp. TaxID=575652 RepID=UPI00260DB991|nr:imm68 putative immunity domain-containing protein [uncultured Aquimarina sp.]
MIENWKDTAFGSDFGGDFLELVENITSDTLTMNLIYTNTDVKKYIDNPDLLKERTDNNVQFTNSKFEQYIHFEDLIIALSVMIVEAELNGEIDLTKAYGNKVLKFQAEKEEIKSIHSALQTIYNSPDSYVMFEMCMEEEREETLTDIKNILAAFEKIMN